MKKVDGFTSVWWFIQAFTMGFMSIMIIPELVVALNKTHREFIDGVWIYMAAIMFTTFFITTATVAGLFVYSAVVSLNEEKKEV